MRKLFTMIVIGAIILPASRVMASNFATEVIATDTNTLASGRPENSLGAPTVDEPTNDGLFSFAFDHEPIPLVPVYNAFSTGMLATVKSGGYLILSFDHPVEDEALNPYGIDFIVFGNAFMDMPGNQEWTNGHPSLVEVTAAVFSEPALVSVSQDGTNWFSFTNGPYADDFPPTLGRQLDTDTPEASLGAWNGWWGAPTDPTFPLPPDLTATNLAGLTVEEIARLYGASAGGTGFDVSGLNLATNAAGNKWFRYVKVEPRPGEGDPEVDAISDVAPVSLVEQWLLQQFTFFEQTNAAVSGMEADPDQDGLVNLMEYALGSEPDGYTETNLITITPAFPLEIHYAHGLSEDIIYTLEASEQLQSWSTNGMICDTDVAYWTNETSSAAFRLRVELRP